ncbi:isochorismatase family protein, partial [bacterium]|nr:isochorismatase family protein [bacterium]
DWPPPDFRRKAGDYAKWARPMEEKNRLYEDIIANRGIIPEVTPQGDDHVIVTGDQLHRLLRHRKILHLFYCGFAANMCVPFRDYGMRAMKSRGYEIILIRDCTTAIEVAETYDDLAISRVCVVDTELTVGYTISSSDLVAACGKVAQS